MIETVEEVAEQLLHGRRDVGDGLFQLVHLVTTEPGTVLDDPLQKQDEAWGMFKLWCTEPSDRNGKIRVEVEPLPTKKYYGTTVTVTHGNRQLQWHVWEHLASEYNSDPSWRECDALGLPHGISLADANNYNSWDAMYYDTHHESQYCYEICQALANKLRTHWLASLGN